MSIEREYKAWIICGRFKAKERRAQIGPFPVYSSIGNMLPLFTTKKAAKRWCFDRGMEVPGLLGIHFTRVVVKMKERKQ